MFSNNCLFYFTFYLLFTSILAVYHRRCRRTKTGCNVTGCGNNDTENLLQDGLIDNHISEVKCSIIPHPKLTINPYKKFKKDEILKPKNVSALCLRCGTCLAIADKLKLVVSEVIEAEPTYDPITLSEIMKSHAEITCATAFKNYDLRRHGNDLVVTNSFSSTTHVASELDFKWPNILKKTCQLYVEKIDFLKWFENSVLRSLDITDELCRSDGLFRECNNVNYHYVILDDGNYYLAMCTCSCASKDHGY